MTVEVRPFRPTDDISAFSAFGDGHGPEIDTPRRRRTLVAVQDGQVVGVVSASWSNRHPDLVAGSGLVLAPHRRRGVGTALLAAVHELAGPGLEFAADDDEATAGFLTSVDFIPVVESWTVRLSLPAAVDLAPASDVDIANVAMDDEVEAFFEQVYASHHRWAGRYVPTPGRPWIRWAGEVVPGSVTVARRAGAIVAAACLTTGEFATGADAFLPPTASTLVGDEAVHLLRAVVGATLHCAVDRGLTSVNVEFDTSYTELATMMRALATETVSHSTVWMSGRARHITRLVGVYDADHTLRGELAYWIGARLGQRHCSLCEITHGTFRRRPEWAECVAGLPVPFDTYHRDDQPDAVREAAGGHYPVVVAETGGGHVVLLTPAELEACGGSIDHLVAAIEASAERLGLRFTPPSH